MIAGVLEKLYYSKFKAPKSECKIDFYFILSSKFNAYLQ